MANIDIFTVDDAIAEGTIAELGLPLTDAGAPINPAAVESAELTLMDARTGAIINSRNAQSVKNVNGGTIDATGIVIVLVAADTALLASEADLTWAERIATLHLVYHRDGGILGTLNHEWRFWIENLDGIV